MLKHKCPENLSTLSSVNCLVDKYVVIDVKIALYPLHFSPLYSDQMFIYEEFMARSSTRQALQQGANFMGMMNVLMQLRKVCNHPDLFEPRSVVTPLVVDPIVYPMASCVTDMRRSNSPFAQVCDTWIFPLWSGCNGTPTFQAALGHDAIQSRELLALESRLDVQSVGHDELEECDVCPALKELNAEICENENKGHEENVLFLNNLNSYRCRASPFPYPQRLVNSLTLPEVPLQRRKSNIHWSPTHLLALRKDLQERADDMREVISRFVFAVPKAGARPVVLETCFAQTGIGLRTILDDAVVQSLHANVRPFREAHARITSFFPDKKLVQFDAGKLQALAELLRERKQGGHKVLIFTQMSKMLDILEAFLNMNGHTYARLDGGTSIDQRQRLMDRFNNDPKVFCFILSTRSGGTGVNLIGADAQAQDRAHR
jgi:SNF2 family DNA or RNA helicase